MILFFYNLALLVVLVAGAPWWLWRMATTDKYRDSLSERLGRVPTRLIVSSRERPVIWLHAVSVGEVLAAGRLIGELDRTFPDHRLVISTTTRTSQELARGRFGRDRVFYCPLDLPWAVNAYLNSLTPRLLILAETEFWPNMLSACFRRGIPVAVVNARISDRSFPRYRRLRTLWQPFLSRISRLLAQTEVDADRLCAIGCNPAAISVAGNLKFDVRAATEADVTIRLKSLGVGLRFLIAGSTLEGEEAALVDAWRQVLRADPQLVMVLAPRHPERFTAAASLLEKFNIPWVRRSQWNSNPPQPLKPGQIVLLDTIGELASVYSLASIAFIGGSLIPAGGHNPLEAAQFAVPIVMGPHYQNFRAITEDLIAHNGLRIADRDQLASVLIELLTDRPTASAMGQRARQVFDQQAGATDRCLHALSQLLSERGVTL